MGMNNNDKNFWMVLLLSFMIGLCAYSNIVSRNEPRDHKDTLLERKISRVDSSRVNVKKTSHKTRKRHYTVSKRGKENIKHFEGCKLERYKDSHGHSIGYGHFLQKGEDFEVISQRQADSLFKADIEYVERVINIYLTKNINTHDYEFSQNFVDGFADVIYNCGAGTVKDSQFYNDLKNKVRYYDEDKVDDDIKFVACEIREFKIFVDGHKDRRHMEHILLAN